MTVAAVYCNGSTRNRLHRTIIYNINIAHAVKSPETVCMIPYKSNPVCMPKVRKSDSLLLVESSLPLTTLSLSSHGLLQGAVCYNIFEHGIMNKHPSCQVLALISHLIVFLLNNYSRYYIDLTVLFLYHFNPALCLVISSISCTSSFE